MRALCDQFIPFFQYFSLAAAAICQSLQVAERAHFQWLKLTISAFQDFPTNFVFGVVAFQVPQVVCQLGAVEWLGLVSFWEGVFMLIEPALEVLCVDPM